MSLERIVEAMLQTAAKDGKFDGLPGRGCQLNVNDYFQLPEHLRIGFTILKNAHCVPQEVALMKEIEELQVDLAGCRAGKQKHAMERQIRERQLNLALFLERHQQKR